MNEIEILISEDKGVRKLHFDSEWVQGAMRIRQPLHLELEYTRDMLCPFLLHAPQDWPSHILCIGLGVGALPRFFHAFFPEAVVETVEICSSVVAVCEQNFNLPRTSERFKIHVDCGAQFLLETQCQYDLIIVDGFDQDAGVGPLGTPEFFQSAKSHLSSGGVLVSNVLTHGNNSMHMIERLQEVFEKRVLALSKCASGNLVAVAFESHFEWPTQEEINDNLAELEARTGANFAKVGSKVRDAIPRSP
ncbi:MAG: fused MFS/spermidine synthase [Limnobacter sp.]|nr:fused MFS/spermidine synthase [Limnobacter sp.]